ncbi:MAG: hypothetical protein HY321_13915 [Armatimonadetes bacterium]|nr:hypothetical protein [Armatimonadota bacterium]
MSRMFPHIRTGCALPAAGRRLVFSALAVLLLAQGCGGARRAVPPGGSTAPEAAIPNTGAFLGTARFTVDVQTGAVSVQSLDAGRALFSGNALRFDSSTLLDQPGNVGRKALRVSLLNRSGDTIGQLPDGTETGVRVILGNFTYLGPELLTNGGFETLGSGSTLWPGWMITPFDGSVTDERTLVNSGSHAAKLTTGAGGQTRLEQIVNGLTPASTLLWSFRTRASGNGAALVYGFWSISNAAWVVANTSTEVTGTDYTDVSVQFTLPSGCTVGDPAFRSSRPSDSVYVDDVSLRQVVSAPSGDGVRLANPDGVTARAGQPYLSYSGSVARGDTLGPRDWVFAVPSGVAGFSFTATVEANTTLWAPPDAGSGAAPSTGQIRTLAGTDLTGFRDGPGSQALFGALSGSTINGICDAAVDASGNVYVTDYGRHSVRRISASGMVTTVAGVLGSTAGNTDGYGTTATLNGPRGIAVTPDGRTLYVACYVGNTIRRISLTGIDPADPASWEVSTVVNPAGTLAYAEGTGSDARTNRPCGIAIESPTSVLFTEYLGNRVRRMQFTGGDPDDPAKWQVSLVAGDASTLTPSPLSQDGTGSGASFGYPAGIDVDPWGAALVAEFYSSKIRRISLGGVVTTLAGGGGGTYADGTGASASFYAPAGIVVDQAGYAYVADMLNNRIRRVSPAGVVTTVAGSSTAGDGDGATNGSVLRRPTGICLDAAANLYVADNGNSTGMVGGTRVRLLQRVVSTAAP